MSKVNLDTAARLDIVCRKGDTFKLTVTFDKVMPNHEDNTIFYKMEVRPTDTSATISNDNFVIERQSNTKQLQITCSAENMALMSSGLFVYDLQVKDTTVALTPTVETYLFGTFEVTEDITVTT